MTERRPATINQFSPTPGWTRALEVADLTVWLTEAVPLLFQSSFPVTQHQWRASAERSADGALNPNPSHFAGDLHPVENVSWIDSTQWCRVLQTSGLLAGLRDRQGNLITNAEVSLPSEAQWEYACRAGTKTTYYTGDGEAALAAAGWYRENSDESTQPVGLLQANEFRLYDMHGNVDEWCGDAWNEHAYKRRVNGMCAPETLGDVRSDRVFRGCSWVIAPRYCRAASRNGWEPSYFDRYLGFRVCLFSGLCPVQQ